MTGDTTARCFDLAFAADAAGRSFIARQFSRYPVHVGRALHVNEAAEGTCAVLLQSCSGGLFEGDRVVGRLHTHGGARAHVASSASTIVHAMRGGRAEQRVELRAAAGSYLEYLPDSLILFPDASLRSHVIASAEPGATIVFSEAFLQHDPTSRGRTFARLDAAVDVVRSDTGGLLAREQLRLNGEAWGARRIGVSNEFGVHGSLWIVRPGDHDELLQRLRDGLRQELVYAGASELPHRAGLQLRILAKDSVAYRAALRAVRDRLHDYLRGPRRATSAEPALA